ncbi:MAG: PP2C family serine/threonine-protein phosphatase, partial [Thermomicrobiales bacterium]
MASVAGSSHVRSAVPCQDRSRCAVIDSDGKDVLMAVAADGAGSASRAEEGAQLTCESFIKTMAPLLSIDDGVENVTQAVASAWLNDFQQDIAQRADLTGSHVRDFACTFLAAIVGPAAAVFLQIGDGAIVVSPCDEPEEFSWIFWPKKGEYENQTTFVTDVSAEGRLNYELVRTRIDEVALFTDGLQRLALHMVDQ